MLLEQSIPFNPSIVHNVRILTVDNDRDSGALYTALFERYGATVMTTESIKEALTLLDRFVPDLLVCEARFLGESINPLIQQVRLLRQDRRKLIPIFVISTYPALNLDQYLDVKVEAYQTKPIDLDQLVAEVWSLILLSNITKLLNAPEGLARLNTGKPFCCCQE